MAIQINLNSRPDIVVTYDEARQFWTNEGYMATFGDYDLDCTYATGKTPLDAIVNLLDAVEE